MYYWLNLHSSPLQDSLWSQPSFVLDACELHACALQHAVDALRQNRAFVRAAFERNAECLCYRALGLGMFGLCYPLVNIQKAIENGH